MRRSSGEQVVGRREVLGAGPAERGVGEAGVGLDLVPDPVLPVGRPVGALAGVVEGEPAGTGLLRPGELARGHPGQVVVHPAATVAVTGTRPVDAGRPTGARIRADSARSRRACDPARAQAGPGRAEILPVAPYDPPVTSDAPGLPPGRGRRRRPRRRRWIVLAVVVVVVVWTAIAGVPGGPGPPHTRSRASTGSRSAQRQLDPAELIRGKGLGKLRAAQQDFAAASDAADSPFVTPFEIVPVVGRQVRSVRALTERRVDGRRRRRPRDGAVDQGARRHRDRRSAAHRAARAGSARSAPRPPTRCGASASVPATR